jgi:hypothetical protein
MIAKTVRKILVAVVVECGRALGPPGRVAIS